MEATRQIVEVLAHRLGDEPVVVLVQPKVAEVMELGEPHERRTGETSDEGLLRVALADEVAAQ